MSDPTQKLLLKEAAKRKIAIGIIIKNVLYLLSYKKHREYLCRQFFSQTNSVGYFCSKNKYITKLLLKENGLRAPYGRIFKKNQFSKAQIFASKIGYPLVMKPSTGLKGYCVFSNTKNPKELKENWHNIFNHYHELLMEEQINGTEYRLLATPNKFLAAVKKVFANKDSLEESYCDTTTTIHPFWQKLSTKIIRTIPGLSYGGIDLIAEDISQKPTDDSYAILEVNASPDISIHNFPKSNIAKEIIDLVFPETKN